MSTTKHWHMIDCCQRFCVLSSFLFLRENFCYILKGRLMIKSIAHSLNTPKTLFHVQSRISIVRNMPCIPLFTFTFTLPPPPSLDLFMMYIALEFFCQNPNSQECCGFIVLFINWINTFQCPPPTPTPVSLRLLETVESGG